MNVTRFGLIVIAICIVWPSVMGVTAEHEAALLAGADLSQDEIHRKPSDTSWGDIYRRFFKDEEAPFSKSYALVIGVHEYEGGWSPLTATRNDPLRVRDYLIDDAGFDLVITLTNERADKDRIQYLMQDVFPELAGPNDRLLFYFSGHGTQRQIGGAGTVGYLPLTDSGRSYSRMISMQEVRGWDRLLRPVEQVLFLIDSCFSGLAGIQPKSDHRNRAVERLAAYGHHLISAGTGDQETIASEEWNGSVFTDSFLRAVKGAADTESEFEKDGVVSLAELREYVGRRVEGEANRIGWSKRISPQLYDLSGDNEGEFFFITKEYKLRGQPQAELESGVPVVLMGQEPAAELFDPVTAEGTMNLRTEDRKVVQEALTALGFDTRGADGIFGANTRLAIARWQRAQGEKATSYLTAGQYGMLLAEADPKLAALEGARQEPEVQSSVESAVGAYATYAPGETFRDCDGCPEMVVLPAGTFLMGSREGEGYDDEHPQHEVAIQSFALGKYEVTFAEWDACAAAGGCTHQPADEGWGRDRRPAINVSWEDAQAYVSWLSKATGERYRLPTEAEWEYAARGETATRYFWGDDSDAGCTFANGHDQTSVRENKFDWAALSCDDGYGQTSPVGSFSPNPFGLDDMSGNVWEWVEDCWNDNYEGAPTDGSAWLQSDCSARVLRGGAWYDRPEDLRSALRLRIPPDSRSSGDGFRVARALTP